MYDRCLALSGFLSLIPDFLWIKLASNAADRSTETPQHLPRLFLMSMPLFEQLSTPQIIVLRFVMVCLHQGKVWLKTGHSGYRWPTFCYQLCPPEASTYGPWISELRCRDVTGDH